LLASPFDSGAALVQLFRSLFTLRSPTIEKARDQGSKGNVTSSTNADGPSETVQNSDRKREHRAKVICRRNRNIRKPRSLRCTFSFHSQSQTINNCYIALSFGSPSFSTCAKCFAFFSSRSSLSAVHGRNYIITFYSHADCDPISKPLSLSLSLSHLLISKTQFPLLSVARLYHSSSPLSFSQLSLHFRSTRLLQQNRRTLVRRLRLVAISCD
jgi:hypothetical protein